MTKPLNVLLGGAGLIGAALNRALDKRGEATVIYDLKTGADLRDYEPEVANNDAYYWFLAWDVGGAKYIMDEAQQQAILRNNLRLCEKVFGWLDKRDARFTFVSSQLAGYPNAYGVTKAVGEMWAKLVGHGLITRLWNCYDAESPSQRSHVIPDLVIEAKTGTIKLLTSGEERRQFLHADDAADALIFQRESQQSLADVTSGAWVSIREVAELIANQFSATVSPGSEPGYSSLVEPTHWLEGWQLTIDLSAGIEMVIKKMRTNNWL
ncbi:MAG: NAD-dependent epimerase/dehydratase family protein [Acidiferrobacterales bacterium]